MESSSNNDNNNNNPDMPPLSPVRSPSNTSIQPIDSSLSANIITSTQHKENNAIEQTLNTTNMNSVVGSSSDVSEVDSALTKDLESRTSKFEERIKSNEWDVDGWIGLFAEAQSKPIHISRSIFERFFKQFPTAVKKNFFLAFSLFYYFFDYCFFFFCFFR
jgi:hypothetical protein